MARTGRDHLSLVITRFNITQFRIKHRSLLDTKWSLETDCTIKLYIYSSYSTDCIANMQIDLDSNNGVIKRL